MAPQAPASPAELLPWIARAALCAVHGQTLVAQALRETSLPDRPVRLIALGKAAQAMAMGAHTVWGARIRHALVISKQGHLDHPALAQPGWVALEAEHPVPGPRSLEAGRLLRQWMAEHQADETLLFLLSGGASSLAEAPIPGLTLADLARAHQWLLGSGLDIQRVNRVRRRLSLIKGGGLLNATAFPRHILCLAISDVPGDDPGTLGSGPLVADPGTSQGDEPALPDWLADWCVAGDRCKDQAPSCRVPVHILANYRHLQHEAAAVARRCGLRVDLDARFHQGDAETLGRALAESLRVRTPGMFVVAAEPTVCLPEQPGQGGRNQHLALAAACALRGSRGAYLLSLGTDGTDGPGNVAGALVDGDTYERIQRAGLNPEQALRRADSGTVLGSVGALVYTGPTGTNVMDLILGLKTA